MYKKFYLMQKEPFESHPSRELFYKSAAHQNGWKYLLTSLKKNEPIVLLAGEYGAGKTLLCLKLMKLLEMNTNLTSVCVSTPTYTFSMLLEKILVELGIPLDGIDTSDESRLQKTIYEHFEKKTDEKKKFLYVVIDDTQEFSFSFINKLRLFTSYNFSEFFPIRIILFTHQSFLKMLSHDKMVAFGQRIKRIYYLKPFDFEDTREYIYFRLIHSGASGKPVFEDKAIRVIQNISKGNPRLINNICDNCLLLASSEGSTLINSSLVSQAMAMGKLMGSEEIQSPRETSSSAHEAPDPVSSKLPLPEDIVYARKSANDNFGPRQRNESFHNEDNYTRVPPPRPREYENDPPEREAEGKIDRGNRDSRYRKKSFIFILILIILFLVFYLFNQYKANNMYNLQSSSEQIIKTVPERLYTLPGHTYDVPDRLYTVPDRTYNVDDHLYTVENLDLFNKGNKKELSSNMITRKNDLEIEKSYHPIILMGNLM